MIICFSGTGNSRLVALELQRQLADEQLLELSGELLLDPAATVHTATPGHPIVWVMPVYSWGVPPVVENFIRKAKIKGANELQHFLVMTCGDDIGYADNSWRKLTGRRGWNPRGTFSVQMPNTYVLMEGFDVDDPGLAQEKLDAMPGRVAEVAAAIRRGFSESDVVRGKSAWMKTALIFPMFRRFCMSPRPFHTTDVCTGCGKCAANCPMQNITMVAAEGDVGTPKAKMRPQWGQACALCLRCYHICPSGAVAYGKATDKKSRKPVTL